MLDIIKYLKNDHNIGTIIKSLNELSFIFVEFNSFLKNRKRAILEIKLILKIDFYSQNKFIEAIKSGDWLRSQNEIRENKKISENLIKLLKG